MKSPAGLRAAIVFLSFLPLAVLYQALFSSGFEAFIHVVLAVGAFLLARAVFDFDKVPKWINRAACCLIAVEAVIFLLQGMSHVVRDEALTRIAYQVLGQRLEGWLVDAFVLWCIVMWWVESRGRTRILGAVALSAVIGFEIYRYAAFYRGMTPAESLKLLLLLLFVWLLFESRRVASAPAAGAIQPR